MIGSQSLLPRKSKFALKKSWLKNYWFTIFITSQKQICIEEVLGKKLLILSIDFLPCTVTNIQWFR